MAFLDGAPNLRRTVFDDDDLVWARQYLVNSIRFLDSDWLREPRGPLGESWNSDGDHSASRLIHIAQIMREIDQATNASSVPTLHKKLRSILRPVNDNRFEDDLIELEAGAHLARYATPIFFEPLATDESHGDANRRSSPDYAFAMPEGFVYFEVTRLNFGFANDWEIGTAAAAEAMRAYVWDRNLRRSIQLTVPLTASRADLARLHSADILADMERHLRGLHRIRMTGGEAQVAWGPIAEHFDGALAPASLAPVSIAAISTAPGPVFEVATKPTVEDDLERVVINSIRNRLGHKRKQMTADAPYVLVMRIGQLDNEAVAQAIFRRIFPNPIYAWITGIVLFEPMRRWDLSSPAALLQLLANENSKYPISSALRSMLRGEAQFHLRPTASQTERPTDA